MFATMGWSKKCDNINSLLYWFLSTIMSEKPFVFWYLEEAIAMWEYVSDV